jgi:2-amino-4-hydroxy-6-hydroxymethyldihydropteridine diphosphokinase
MPSLVMKMNIAYLLIGGNMGERQYYLSSAKELIEKDCGEIVLESSIYETAAWGLEEQAAFLNQAIEIKTPLSAIELLEKILAIEERLGRKREIKYGPRLVDIDILLFNKIVVKTEGLSIPHPQMQNRRFVLMPLAEIAAKQMHPILKKKVEQLLKECPDKLPVQKFQ